MSIRTFKSKYTLYYAGLAVLFSTGVAFVCGAVVSEYTHESERAMNSVLISPSKVNIGTRTSAVIPTSSNHSSSEAAPMISGNTVRSYARGGYASPVRIASYKTSRTGSVGKIKTTTISGGANGGGGGGGGGSASAGVSSNGSSRRRSAPSASGAAGASFSIGAVPVPTMAKASRSYAAESYVMDETTTAEETLSGRRGDPASPGVPGSNPGTPDNPVIPPIPVGGTPWLLMMILALAYGVKKSVVSR